MPTFHFQPTPIYFLRHSRPSVIKMVKAPNEPKLLKNRHNVLPYNNIHWLAVTNLGHEIKEPKHGHRSAISLHPSVNSRRRRNPYTQTGCSASPPGRVISHLMKNSNNKQQFRICSPAGVSAPKPKQGLVKTFGETYDEINSVAGARTMTQIQYKKAAVKQDMKIFYREAGAANSPVLVLLHGFPSSSHMFRNLIPPLADEFHLLAPDYPGFGNSDAPAADKFTYSFDHLAEVMQQFLQRLGLERFSLYMHGYGVPIGLRLAVRNPEWIDALIVQNGNAYREGFTPVNQPIFVYWNRRIAETEALLRRLLTREGIRWQYIAGARHPHKISPDAWNMDYAALSRPGNDRVQLDLLYDYQTNVRHYPQWHEYFRSHQPPTMVLWGKNDPIFSLNGALAFKRDLPRAEIHLLDSGHYALEEEHEAVAEYVRHFLRKTVKCIRPTCVVIK